MKVKDFYRPGGGVLAILLKCGCVRTLKKWKGKSVPVGWACRKHDPGAKGDAKSRPLPTMAELVELIGQDDRELALVAGRILGAGVRARRGA